MISIFHTTVNSPRLKDAFDRFRQYYYNTTLLLCCYFCFFLRCVFPCSEAFLFLVEFYVSRPSSLPRFYSSFNLSRTLIHSFYFSTHKSLFRGHLLTLLTFSSPRVTHAVTCSIWLPRSKKRNAIFLI